MNNNKQLVASVVGVLVLVVMVVGVSFAVFNSTTTGKANTINSGKISMSYAEPSNVYSVTNALPTYASVAMQSSNYFEFTVTSHATTNADDTKGVSIPYEINITSVTVDSGKTALNANQVMVGLTKVSGGAETSVKQSLISSLTASAKRSGAKQLYTNTNVFKQGAAAKTETYRLRAWIHESVDASSFTTTGKYQYKFKVNVNGEANKVN